MNEGAIRMWVECPAGQGADDVFSAELRRLAPVGVACAQPAGAGRAVKLMPSDCTPEQDVPAGQEACAAEAVAESAGGPRAFDRSLWPDAWLVTAVREDLPDPEALNVLAKRFGPPLWRRCLRLTGNWDKAGDLAQETWCRLLRNRGSLRPEKNFRAYLTTVATNIWRDGYRAARRAGAMAEYRLMALDAAGHVSSDRTASATNGAGGGELPVSGEAVPDAYEVETQAQRLLLEDLRHVLACLGPLHREVLLARFLRGESCATIGRRHGRTEQAISGWVREALRQARGHLEASGRPSGRKPAAGAGASGRKGPVSARHRGRIPSSRAETGVLLCPGS